MVFGYPGGNILPLYDALYDSPIRHILVRHEQAAAHMADGYARATGKVGVCIATSGPGAINLVTGIATAHMDSVPMIAITGNVPTYHIGTGGRSEARGRHRRPPRGGGRRGRRRPRSGSAAPP
ncbi:MAG: hypothetical protein LOD85_04080, partial [Clostridia bacterium]